MRHAGGFAAVMLLWAARAQAQSWADMPDDDEQFKAEFKASKDLCRKVKGVKPPEADKPDAAARKALKGCHSEALYYGLGLPADPVRARQCAFLEMASEDSLDPFFSGRAMLMTIYANGVGAKRDLDVALELACNLGASEYEYDGRAKHLAELKAKGWAGTNFSVCDDITSGLAQGVCTEHEARLADQKRTRSLGKLQEKWSAADRQAFVPLEKARDAFIQTRGDNELDSTGSAGASFIISDQQAHHDAFQALLEQLEQGQGPSASAEDLKAADAALNKVYQDVQKYPQEDSWGSVNKAGIKKTQRAWLKYRDAWLAFAQVHSPSVSRDALAHELTKKRTAELQYFLEP
jgi:uncharacterized protein YecT (DUF1311 family)